MMESTLIDLTEARRLERVESGPMHSIERPCASLDQLMLMVRAFRANGGVVTGDQLSHLCRSLLQQPISTIARWIVGRHVVCFDWNCQPMLPLFQIELTSMRLRPSVAEVVQELAGTFDDWDLALWFATPNAWLDGRAPVQVILSDPCAVLDTARADRFIAAG
jgi:hypothetical protein